MYEKEEAKNGKPSKSSSALREYLIYLRYFLASRSDGVSPELQLLGPGQLCESRGKDPFSMGDMEQQNLRWYDLRTSHY